MATNEDIKNLNDMPGVYYAQKFLGSMVMIPSMVIFAAFTVVSSKELGEAKCKLGDDMMDGTDSLKNASNWLFFLLFVMIGVVSWGTDSINRGLSRVLGTENDTVNGIVWVSFRIIFNELPLLAVAIIFSMTLVSRCPISSGASTSSEEDATFIDEAGYFQGMLLTLMVFVGLGQLLVIFIREARRWNKAGNTKRKQYEYVMMMITFIILAAGGLQANSNFGHTSYVDITVRDSNNASIDGAALEQSCTNSTNDLYDGPFGADTDSDRIKSYFMVVGILAIVHIVELLAVELGLMRDEEKWVRFARVIVEPIVQAIILILGLFCIAPFAYLLQNPPCNYQYTELLHSEDGANGIMLFVVGYTLMLGSQTLKIYRHYAADETTAGSFGRESLLG